MSSEEQLFREAVSVTLQNWPSFQVAISNGMGGSNTEAKVEWMCDSIVELFVLNEKIGIHTDEVLDYITEVIDNEFDTIIEDGSEQMVSSNLVNYFQHIRSGDRQFVVDKLHSLKQKQALLTAQCQQQVISDSSSLNTESKNTSSNTQDIEMKDDNKAEEDGWTVVKRKK